MNTRTLGTGTWISVGAPVITEAVAGMGFDWLLLDLEHGSMTEADLLPNLHAAAASGVKVIVRIGEFRPSLVGRVLDFGAAGIMVPHVSDAATAAPFSNLPLTSQPISQYNSICGSCSATSLSISENKML